MTMPSDAPAPGPWNILDEISEMLNELAVCDLGAKIECARHYLQRAHDADRSELNTALAAIEELTEQREIYRARWLSCMTPEEAERLRTENAELRADRPAISDGSVEAVARAISVARGATPGILQDILKDGLYPGFWAESLHYARAALAATRAREMETLLRRVVAAYPEDGARPGSLAADACALLGIDADGKGMKS